MKKLLAATALALVLSAPLAQAAPDGPAPYKKMEKMLEGLPAEKAAAFKATLKAEREKHEDKRQAAKKLHEELQPIITAPTFDKAAFLAKHKEISALRSEMDTGRNSAMAEALSALTQAERATIAEGMKKGHKRPYPGDADKGEPK